MSNSSLVSCTKISPNKSSPRNHAIDTITIHCVVGQCSVETLGAIFAPSDRQASSNYGVGYDGRIGMYVEEKDRSWCTSSSANDNRAITIEVASDTTDPYTVNAKAFSALLDLVTDICKRNGIKKLVWSNDKNTRVNHLNGCNMTVHRDYANKSCPGDYLYKRGAEIAAEVNKRLGAASTQAPATQTPQTTTGGTVTLAAGTKLDLKDVKLYGSSTAAEAAGTKTGTYYVWSDGIVKNRIRITNSTANVGKDKQVTGWISVDDAKAAAGGSGTQTAAPTAPAAFTPYLVRITASVLNVRKGPSTSHTITTTVKRGEVYTIVGEQDGWGKLKSGAGWIYLGYTEKK